MVMIRAKIWTATERKLAMAKYYLQRMKDTQNNPNGFDFECELESFLAHTGSVTNLPRPYNQNWFMEQEYGHKPNFREWYEEKVAELQSDEIMHFLRGERNIAIHFRRQNIHTLCTTEANFTERLTVSDSFEFTAINVIDGTEKTTKSTHETPVQQEPQTEYTFNRVWEFKTDELTGNKEVIPVCEKYLETLERLVTECRLKGF